MQHQARRLIQSLFTWQRIAGDLATRYRGIVEKGSTRNPSEVLRFGDEASAWSLRHQDHTGALRAPIPQPRGCSERRVRGCIPVGAASVCGKYVGFAIGW
jgi:hypothetical protein